MLNIFQKMEIHLFLVGFGTITIINCLLVDCGDMTPGVTNETKFSFDNINPEIHLVLLYMDL